MQQLDYCLTVYVCLCVCVCVFELLELTLLNTGHAGGEEEAKGGGRIRANADCLQFILHLETSLSCDL